ncbi:MAG: hypothetical protein AABZ47_13925, partial [Planctomycetota bacterium]
LNLQPDDSFYPQPNNSQPPAPFTSYTPPSIIKNALRLHTSDGTSDVFYFPLSCYQKRGSIPRTLLQIVKCPSQKNSRNSLIHNTLRAKEVSAKSLFIS